MMDALVTLVCIGVPGIVIFHAFKSAFGKKRGEGSDGSDGSWTYSGDSSAESGSDSGGGGDGGGGD
ncbi:MAG: hypothetical protein CFE31_09100 [Rhizobiales bacterium PAR1]|nr:MAG: hypothetical protein CFE31_09100 [Rhizobiales bacterium PAR1]